ncbi:protein SCO1 homolog, mitochondrial-like [Contarinia nasturtii]|uniref:protein SCO1 homolog, mitochondrial-like n=1 Tax=Contarinia nasturtii TaxID=265458 RepID=UPI0012D40CC4|nr:protein SCO1 homolog, mitochondrial-like [Contarinia nasturtii]
MSWLVRSQCQLFRQFSGSLRTQFLYPKCKYSQQSIAEPTISRKKKYIYTAFLGASVIAFSYYVHKEREYALMKERQKALKKAGIGGKWELIDPNGNAVSSDNFKGKWCMIYFGFTHCPDICPDEMEKMTNVVKGLEKENIELQPIFITIDPDRDTKEVVGKYVKEFSDKIIGLTGAMDEIKKVCHAYHVYFKAGPKDKSDDYIVDHTIILYLVDPNGEFIDYYGLGKTSDEIIPSVKVNMDKWKKMHESSNLLTRLLS